jgi:hypothetical protein
LVGRIRREIKSISTIIHSFGIHLNHFTMFALTSKHLDLLDLDILSKLYLLLLINEFTIFANQIFITLKITG